MPKINSPSEAKRLYDEGLIREEKKFPFQTADGHAGYAVFIKGKQYSFCYKLSDDQKLNAKSDSMSSIAIDQLLSHGWRAADAHEEQIMVYCAFCGKAVVMSLAYEPCSCRG